MVVGWGGGDCGIRVGDSSGGSRTGGCKAASPLPVLAPGPFQGAEAAASLLSGSARGLEGIRNFSGINKMYWLQSYLNRGGFKQIQLF